MRQVYLSSEDLLMQDEAIQALVALGYDLSDAAKAVEKIDKNLVSKRGLDWH